VHTILNLSYSRFEVIEREVADLVFQRVEIHGCDGTRSKA
jgi:hypothetical protein